MRRRQIGIGTVQVLAIAGLVSVSVAGALYIGFVNARNATRDLLRDRAMSILDTGVRRVDALLQPVVSQAVWLSETVADGRLDLDDRAQLEAFLAGALAATPQVSGIAVAGTDGRIFRYVREERRLVEEDGLKQLGLLPMLESLRDAQGPVWGELIRPARLRSTAINLRVPLYRDGRYLGVGVMAVGTSDLSYAFARDDAAPAHVPYILYDRDWVLAHSYLIAWDDNASGPVPLPRVEELGDPVLAEVWSKAAYQPAIIRNLLIDPAQGSVVAVDTADRTWVYFNRTLDRYGPRPWTVGAYLDADTQDDVINRMLWLVALGAGLLSLSVAAAVLTARLSSAPIRQIALAAAKVRGGDLAAVPTLPPSALTELNTAARAFNDMVAGLRERETIRALFGKYVPEEVAAALLREGGMVAPRTVEATVLFADIEGFTAFTESTLPERVVVILNDYFSALVDIVEAHGGVITQFQGDAILATFNVPIAHADHAAQAVRAARRILTVLEGSSFAGHRLRCRIGISTGTVTAAAVGAAGRLNYTVHGNTVNLAARLEALNKDHGTRVLLAEATAARLDPKEFSLAPLGDVPIRGKSETVAVFTLADAPRARHGQV